MQQRTLVALAFVTSTLAAPAVSQNAGGSPPEQPPRDAGGTGAGTDDRAAEAAFDDGMAAVHEQMARGKWAAARASLLALLDQHAERLYVRAQRDAIVYDLTQCAFWSTVAVPAPQDLLSGKVESWSASSGRIKIRYTRSTMGDWRAEGDVLLHPAAFRGPYTVTIEDASYPDGSLRVLFDVLDDGCCAADFGMASRSNGIRREWIPASIHRLAGSADELVAEKDSSPAKPGEKFTAQLKVGKNRVDLLYDRKTVLQGKRERGDAFGGVGLLGSYDDVLLEGDVEPSWLQGVVDQRVDELRADFVGRFRPEKELPKWLFERPQVARTPPKHEIDSRVAKSNAARAAFEPLTKGDWAGGLQRLEGLGDADLAPGDRAFLLALCHHRRGDPAAARPFAEQALAAQPEATHARVVLAEVLLALRNRAQAMPLLRRAVADDPGEEHAVQSLFVALLEDNRVDEATRLVRDAKCRHGMWDETRELDAMLAMRLRGPSWPRRFRYESKHYAVHSDIDARICADAAMLLERAYVNLKAQLGWLDESGTFARFEVYLFSGESGYQEYARRILGSAMPHTAGLYSPVLKQLLIWNLPKREDMERTIAHEGFHQYLDRAMQDPPVWLNEGTAEFWETMRRENGSLQGGQVRGDHVATLLRAGNSLPTLREFVYGSRADFYEHAPRRYAQAWALVHFLRKGPNAYQRIWNALWGALKETDLTAEAALDRAFQGVDWQAFQNAFWEHVRGLAKGK